MKENQQLQQAFADIFEIKKTFPRWYQPPHGVGPLLCLTQEEWDDYDSRDWSPKPLPGSEVPVAPKSVTLEDLAKATAELHMQREQLAAEQIAAEQRLQAMEQRIADMVSRDTGMVPSAVAPGEASPSAALSGGVVGGLSDTSVDEAAKPDVVAKSSAKSSK